MAQNVTIAGASYPDVPAIDVAKTGGGTARFVDTSDANATAGDIASGKSAYVGGVKLTGTNSGSGGVIPMTEITWSALKALRDGGNLVPGMQYRITDYNTIVTGYYDLSMLGAQGYLHYGESAGHQFDVIVTADDDSTLNENARAARHSGDTYFANSNLAAWELKYCLDNDATRFSFANVSGKGVIFGMKDEYGNEAGYDFKNWKFVRYALKLADATQDYTPEDTGLVYDPVDQPNRYGSMYHVFMALQAYMQTGSYVSPFIDTNGRRTIVNYDLAAGANILGAIQMASIDATYKAYFNADTYYTFDYYDVAQGTHTDMSLNKLQNALCRNNKFATEIDMAATQLLNNNDLIGIGGNVFMMNSAFVAEQSNPSFIAWYNDNEFGFGNFVNTFGNSCYSNVFGNDCSSNVFGKYCYSNVFGNDCYSNVFGNSCYSNVFGISCGSNVFGIDCYSNVFGNSCYSNVFGNSCYSNVFGNSCYSNVFGDSCYSNVFGISCGSNVFGDACYSNVFGIFCYSNVFGIDCYSNVFGNHCYSNVFGNDCYSNVFGISCDSNVFGQSDTNNEFIDYVSKVEFKADRCSYITIEPNGWVEGIVVEDEIGNLTLPDTQMSGRGYRVINDTGNASAILIHRTGYGQESAVKTTDGGQTWTSV